MTRIIISKSAHNNNNGNKKVHKFKYMNSIKINCDYIILNKINK